MTSKNKILLLFAHPSLNRSEINSAMFQRASSLDFVTCVDLYRQYPTFKIDIDKEQQQLLDHDVIIFQFPFYWYSTPSILKEWQDLVLEHGFAYGENGTALHGKVFLCAVSAGGNMDAYSKEGCNHYYLNDLLLPLKQTANLTGMHYLPPFALFGSRTAKEENRLTPHLDNWQKLLTCLHSNSFNEAQTKSLSILESELESFTFPIKE